MLRSISILTICLWFFFSDCRKSQPLEGNLGVIVGWNYGACETCGGFYFNLANDTAKNAGTLYALNYSDSVSAIVDSLSNEYEANQQPIFIYVAWKPLSLTVPGAPANWVTVTSIKKR
jgi:hypothetical protein